MDTRADFQRLLEDMDKAVQAKRQELSELDEHLERARSQLSEKEAQELSSGGQGDSVAFKQLNKAKLEEYFQELKRSYQQQLDIINEELSELESANVKLSRENQELRKELGSAKENYEIAQVKSNVLVADLDEVRSANLELNLRLATSEAELQKNRKLLEKSHDEDKVLIVAFEEKLDALKKEIQEKDQEILELHQSNNMIIDNLGLYHDDSSTSLNDDAAESPKKLPLTKIANAIRDKNEQIDILKSKLAQATKDLEKNVELIESLHQSDVQDGVRTRPSSESLSENYEELTLKVKMLDAELDSKDKQLNLLEFKTHYYERILPSILSDTITDLSQALRQKSIDRVAEERGQYLLDSLEKLTGQLDDTKKLLEIIESERDSNKAKDIQIRRLVANLNKINGSDEDLADEILEEVEPQQDSMEKSVAEIPVDDAQVHEEKCCGENQTKRENELLELAMKEILLYIKWTDAQCGSIVIDCPSLEKLCQMIEAKYMAETTAVNSEMMSDESIPSDHSIKSHLFQLIILKSELDLLRGQNEQLRADAKLQRREYLKLIEDKIDLQTNYDREKTRHQLEMESETNKTDNYELDNQETVIDSKEKMKCETCANLAHLSNYLLQCIARIESRVKANDELFIGRLTSLHRLNQLLERDLTFHEAILARFRREYQTSIR